MAEVQVQGWGTSAAPNDRTTKDSERLEVVALEATFDGSAAAGAFVPAVQIISDSGAEVGTFPLAGQLAVGDSVTVTFAPFLGSGGGIRYEQTNVGGWLHVETTTSGGTPSRGIYLQSATAVEIDALGGSLDLNALGGNNVRLFGTSLIFSDANSAQIIVSGGTITIAAASNHDTLITTRTGHSLTIRDHNSSPILRIDDDGSIHGRAAVGAITWDL